MASAVTPGQGMIRSEDAVVAEAMPAWRRDDILAAIAYAARWIGMPIYRPGTANSPADIKTWAASNTQDFRSPMGLVEEGQVNPADARSQVQSLEEILHDRTATARWRRIGGVVRAHACSTAGGVVETVADVPRTGRFA